jgi:transposase
MTYRKVGADVSKSWIDVAIVVCKQLLFFHFENSLSGFVEFEQWLIRLKAGRVHVCMEHTGRYHVALAGWLFAKGHRVSVASPFAVSRFGEGRMKRSTNDQVSAETLLMFLKERKPALWEPLGEAYDELRELVRYRQNVSKRLAVLRNQLASGPLSAFVQESFAAQISYHELELERVETRIREHVNSDAEMKESLDLLQSMCGVRFANGIRLLGEIGPWQRFPSSRTLACYAGYLPCKASSGTLNKRNNRGAQWGNRHLREAVSSCVLTVSRREDFKAFYQRLALRGKEQDARKARKRKFIELVYGVLRSRKPFDEKLAFGP